MFIQTRRAGYEADGTQVASGRFLMLMLPDPHDPETPEDMRHFDYHMMRGLVRFVSMRQLGHFMMGTARVGDHKLTVSGAYGNDGLLMDVPWDVYQKGIPVPDDLQEEWAKGGGHNSAGSEGEEMRKWGASIDKNV